MNAPYDAPKAPPPWETPEKPPRRKVPVWVLVVGAFVLGVFVGASLVPPRSDGRSYVATALFGVASNNVTVNEGEKK